MCPFISSCLDISYPVEWKPAAFRWYLQQAGDRGVERPAKRDLLKDWEPASGRVCTWTWVSCVRSQCLYVSLPFLQVVLHSAPEYKGAKLRIAKNSNKFIVHRKEYLDFITRTGEHNWSQGVVVRMNRNWCNVASLEALPVPHMIPLEFPNSCLQQASFLSEHTFLPRLHTYHFSTSE